MSTISRRSLLSLGLAATAASLAGCAGSSTGGPHLGGLLDASGPRRGLSGRTISKPNYSAVYASHPGEPAPVEKFDYSQVDPTYRRQEVEYLGQEVPGTVVVDPASRHLFFIDAPGKATRYGVARVSAGREPRRSTCGAAGQTGCRRRKWLPVTRRSAPSSWRRHAGRAYQEVRQTRSGRGRCISSPTTATRAIAL
jgi:lipoprotein-anchoring transpeptidase ErfK/SrfK